MSGFPEANAVVYCEGMFQTTNGKTAHGLVRRCERYRILSVVDSTCAGRDAAELLDGKPKEIPILRDIDTALAEGISRGLRPTHLVIGLAPDGGRLPSAARQDVKRAIELGFHIDSGLHDFLSDDVEIASLAARHHVHIRDIRKPPPREKLHFFSGKIEEVTSLKVALLGTDSAVGKRTTAWIIVDALREAGKTAEFIGTGQTGWMQGARYSIVLDSLVADFMAGEIEHAVWSAWKERDPDFIIIEGQGSLMNPAYPGGYEILAAGRPDVVILQHAPARKEYDGFPGYPLHPLETQIRAIELISGKPVIAVTLNHEHLTPRQTREEADRIRKTTGLPAVDPLCETPREIFALLLNYAKRQKQP